MSPSPPQSAEHLRVGDPAWRRWGPYLAERAWGTVREDYSADGDAWNWFPHDDARWRTYRWNEDGLGGFCDDQQQLCMAVTLWNGVDPILKERLFGLNNHEGNHGEDVKEVYYYTDATPTASYLEMRYLYPVSEFPYEHLVTENGRRGRHEPEFELEDTGVFESGFFEVAIRYAKAGPDEVVLEVEAINRSDNDQAIWVIPTLWFRNTWSWNPAAPKPTMKIDDGSVKAAMENRILWWSAPNADELLFCDNETNGARGQTPSVGHPKDSIHRYLVDGDTGAANPAQTGTKVGAVHRLEVTAGGTARISVSLSDSKHTFDHAAVIEARRIEADEYYATMPDLTQEKAAIRRQAYAGLVWTKQFYHYNVARWLTGDPENPRPPPCRGHIRNGDWEHIRNHDVLSMPDAWEYPWYATWDLAFHAVPFADIDSGFAKNNLETITSARYLHPNGQMPAYEWEFGNVNPPVVAWAARKVFDADRAVEGKADRAWLAKLFYLLSLNYTWWQNREDIDGNNVFQGGFLGLDNIALFDRSAAAPTDAHLDQSDGTAWMGFFSLGMLRIALILAQDEPRFEDLAMRFFSSFGEIAEAMLEWDHCLWNPDDGFFYDVLHTSDGQVHQLGVRSMVGLLPLVAVEVIPEDEIVALPEFARLVAEYEARHPANSPVCTRVRDGKRLLAVLDEHQLRSVLTILLDPGEFLSPFGVRSLSKAHSTPYLFDLGGARMEIAYEPGESSTADFGGNSNWRGPIWFPINYLIIEALREYHSFFGDTFTVEYPTGSGEFHTLASVANDLSRRLVSLFETVDGRRPSQSPPPSGVDSPLLLFHEYFDAETGRGLGASHQTGWTALVAKVLK